MKTQLGLENFLENHLGLVIGKRVGLVASASSVDAQLVNVVERFYRSPQVQLAALYGPEHGLRGESQAGDKVSSTIDSVTGLPIYSLYGETKKPTAKMLSGVDVLIIDLQDGGARFYTYLYTMAYVMQAAAESGLPVIVLDRPAPLNGSTTEGPILDEAFASFVGLYPVPIRYGLTIGECARLFNKTFAINCDLTVIPMQGWSRNHWFDQTGQPFIPPSPNLPTLDSMTVYPGTCLFEGTNLSEGRGTTKPFEYIGAPWILSPEVLARQMNELGLMGVRFRPVHFTPTFSKYAGEHCRGVQVYVFDREQYRPIETALYLMTKIRESYESLFSWRDPWNPGGHYPVDLLSGNSSLRQHLDAGKPLPELIQSWEEPLQAFDELRSAYRHYTS